MRSEAEIKDLIINFATKDERIRAVLLNGSRANPHIQPDKYQDFDIVFIVNDLISFTSNHDWTNIFGEKIIWQLPNEMSFGSDKDDLSFSYLMRFKDGNRIDLTLFPVEHFPTNFSIDSLTIIWLDKDKLFSKVNEPDDKDYRIHKPTEKEYWDVCNEFWWVSTYVAKGLLRNEITYAKEMLETVVRPMFMKLIEWKIGAENNFSVSFGKAGRFMSRYLTKDFYADVLKTYSDYDIENNWKSLFIMIRLFEETSNELSLKLEFRQNKTEQENAINYLRQAYDQRNYH